uniref:B box-type domain-containing protein n=1 Tax=Terrapene triunguis TaxID=2587831 RepID=A0A674K7W5_9SAUR
PRGARRGARLPRLRALRERGRWCPEHRERPLELFCADCALCVCALCPVLGAHRGHRVSLVGPAAQGTKVTGVYGPGCFGCCEAVGLAGGRANRGSSPPGAPNPGNLPCNDH